MDLKEEAIGVLSAPLLNGATCVRYGAFEAQTSGTDLVQTDNARVWKVWLVQDEKSAHKIAQGLSRIAAMRLAQACAEVWRAMDKPFVTEIGLEVEGDGRRASIIINKDRRVVQLVPPEVPAAPPAMELPVAPGTCTYCGGPRSQCDPFRCREH